MSAGAVGARHDRRGRLGRGAFKALSGVVWLFIAYMSIETDTRILAADV
ncbi:hypothetical protein [Gemmatimonas sp.]